MRISTFFFLTRRGLRNLGKHWAMTIACIATAFSSSTPRGAFSPGYFVL